MVKPLDPSQIRKIDDPLMLAALAYLNGDEDIDEKVARRAIAILLRRQPIDKLLCMKLSLLFDPDVEWPRIAEVKFRKAGRRSNRRRDLLIGGVIHSYLADGMSVEDSVATVADEAGLSPEAVWKVWGQVKGETKPYQPRLTVIK